MTIRVATRRANLYPAQVAAAGGWWLAEGTIDSANVMDYHEDISADTDYNGTTISAGNPWTLAMQIPSDGSAGAVIWESIQYYCQAQLWPTSTMRWELDNTSTDDTFTPASPHVWFFINDGTNSRLYYNGSYVDIHPATTNTTDSEWRAAAVFKHHTGSAYKGVAVYDIALDSTQRSSLYTTMSAL